jgi:hypothetical protein
MQREETKGEEEKKYERKGKENIWNVTQAINLLKMTVCGPKHVC